jgi:hypothetical protein
VLTAAQLERAVRAYRRVSSEEAREVHEDEYLASFWEEDGSLVVRGRLAPEDAALFLRALEAARDSLWKHAQQEERGSAEPRLDPRRPTNTEALVALADAALANEGSRSGGERYQVVLHIDEAVLARGCRFPGCENHRFVDAHHVRHWARGGETKLDNLVLLCRRHHRFVHEGGYGVDERMRFYDPRGRPIPSASRPPPGSADQLLEHNRRSGVAIGPETCENGDGDRMDLALTVDALLQIGGDSRTIVTGPSLASSTSIRAPNLPVATSTPSSRRAAQNAS